MPVGCLSVALMVVLSLFLAASSSGSVALKCSRSEHVWYARKMVSDFFCFVTFFIFLYVFFVVVVFIFLYSDLAYCTVGGGKLDVHFLPHASNTC